MTEGKSEVIPPVPPEEVEVPAETSKTEAVPIYEQTVEVLQTDPLPEGDETPDGTVEWDIDNNVPVNKDDETPDVDDGHGQ